MPVISDIILSLVSSISISLIIAVLAFLMGRVMSFHNLACYLWLFVLIRLLIPSFLFINLHKITGNINPELSTGNINSAGNQFILFMIIIISISGSLFVLIQSLSRIITFNKLLKGNSISADEKIQQMSAEICKRMGIKHYPQILKLNGNITPIVWFLGRQVKIYLSQNYLENAKNEEIYWILAHELAHVKRKDHLVRMLEWIVTVLLWWNPLIWIAKHNLRMEEEICCDQYVIKKLSIDTKDYASTLLSAVRYIVYEQRQKLPAVACNLGKKGIIRRFGMLLKEKPKGLSWVILCEGLFLIALILLPVSLSSLHNRNHFIFNEDRQDWEMSITLSSGEAEQNTLTIDGIRSGDVDKIINQMGKMYKEIFPEDSNNIEYNFDFAVKVSDADPTDQESITISLKDQ